MPRRLRTELNQKIRETSRIRRRYIRNADFLVTVTTKKNLMRVDLQLTLTLPKKTIVLRSYKLYEIELKRRARTAELVRRFQNRALVTPIFDSEFPTQHRRVLKAKMSIFRKVRKRVESLQQAKLRASLQHRRILDILQSYIYEIYKIDAALLTLPQEEVTDLVNYLIEIAKGNKLFAEIITQKPLLRHLAQKYILYYQNAPETHNIYALRLTPFLLLKTDTLCKTYYIMKVLEATLLKRCALIGIPKTQPFQFYRYFSKRGGEWVNSLSYSSYSEEGSRNDSIICARNDLQDGVWSRKLYEVVFKPHEIRRAVIRALGLRELYDNVKPIGVYAMINRRTRTSKLYDYNANKVLLIGKQRRRFKDIIAKRIT